MFTGIVRELVRIIDITAGAVTTVSLTLPQWGKLAVGESILLHGICSTVTAVNAELFTVEYMAETLKLTTVPRWQVDDQIHAEPSLTLVTPLSGNLVYGHIDGTAEVIQLNPLTLRLPKAWMNYVLLKGAITINGVNLTITQVQEQQVSIELIPHTAKLTRLAQLQPGQQVNIELDYITKVIVETTRRQLTEH